MELIENEYLKVYLTKEGALITSILDKKHDNIELVHQVNDNSWEYQDIQMFPLIGYGKFTHNNKEYKLPLHGILRHYTFDVKNKSNDELTFIYTSNEESKKLYPFDFVSEVTYKLNKNELIVTAKTTCDDNAYYSYGSHTAFKLYTPKHVDLKSELTWLPYNNGCIDPINTSTHDRYLKINAENFLKTGTYIFKNKNKEVVIDNGDKHLIVLKFEAPVIAVWTMPQALDFICVEPWWGISNYKDESKNLEDRLYINKGTNSFTCKFLFEYKG